MEPITVTLVSSVDELQEFFRWLGETREWLAIDVETDGLRWWDGQLRMVQFGDTHRAFAIPWEWYPKPIKDALHSYRGKIVGHNFKFDLHWLNRFCAFDPPWSRCYDTQIYARLLEPNLRSALKDVSKRHVHARAGGGDAVLKKLFADEDWFWDTVPIDHPAYWKYAALDCILTARLAEKLHPLAEAEYGHVLDIELAAQRVLYNMEKRGTIIDRPYTERTLRGFESKIEQFAAWGSAEHGINLGSDQKVIAALMRYGCEFSKLTPSGRIALDESVLLQVRLTGSREARDLAASVYSFRKLRKMAGTYLSKFLALADGDGVLHCSMRQLGAKTGRMSVATPSLQNLPRNEEVRNCFIARDDHQLVLSDFDQIEVRLLAHFSQDPNLIKAILAGDVHSSTARMIYNDAAIDKADRRRQIAKAAVFAKMYGAGVPKFALTAGVTEDQARAFMEMFDALYPNVPSFIGRVQAVARGRMEKEDEGYVTTPFGRKQTIGNERDVYYKLVNYLIQGTAADVMKSQLVALDAAGLGELMTLPVHDEIILDTPRHAVEEASQIVQREMPVPEGFTVPLTADLAVLDRWGTKYAGQTTWIDEAFEDVFAEEIGED